MRRAASTLPPLKSSGAGTTPVIGSTSSGLVPQVTTGAIVGGVEDDLAVEMRALVGEERRASAASAISQAPAFGACGRPLT